MGGDKPWLDAPHRSLYTHVGTGMVGFDHMLLVVEGKHGSLGLLGRAVDVDKPLTAFCDSAGHLLFASSLLYNISALICTMPYSPKIVACVGTWSYIGK